MRGDHVYVDRGLYTHHGIELGGGKVVHYSGEPGSTEPGRVVVSSLVEFLDGGKRRVRRYRDGLPKEASVRLALSRVGEKRYHLALNNCEHFAHWCRTGTPWSKQVASVALKLASALGNVPAQIASAAIKAWSRRRST